MRVSVVIPCWNGEGYLGQALGSVLEQSRPVHEVVVVDDGSTDASLDVAQRFAASHPGLVRVFSQRSGNAALTRNLGAQVATGDALLFLDADDVLGPEAVAGLVEALQTAPDGVAICPWFRLELVDGTWVQRPPSCAPRRPGESALSAWLVGWYHPPCSVLWSREAFERVGRWDDLSTNDDGDLMMRALADGVPLAEATRGAGYYRRLPQGETSWSAARLTRRGLESRTRTVLKVVAWLERRQQLDAHRDAVSRALEMIAFDAGDDQPDLRRSALDLAQRYGAASGRLGRRLRRSRGADQLRPLRQRLRQARSRRASVTSPDGAQLVSGLGAAAHVAGRDVLASAAPGRVGQPTVSVVIPTYDRADLLRRALDSVLAQTLADFEVVVVDDHSSDDTPQVVAAYDDPRVRYVRQPENRGVSAARNRGIRDSHGEFIAFLDSDDEWLPDKLALQVALFQRSPEDVGLVYGGVEDHDGQGRVELRTPTHRGDVYGDLLVRNVVHGCSGVVVRRRAVAAAGLFDEDLPAIEDYDYWVRVARFFRVDFVDVPVMRYHDDRDARRRSLDAEANRAARSAFYARYQSEMRRLGVRHLFLAESARRHLDQAPVDRRGARRLSVQALLLAPASRPTHVVLARSLAPARARRLARLAVRAGTAPRGRTRPLDEGAGNLVVLLYSAQPRTTWGGVQDVCARLTAGLRARGHTVVEAGPDVADVSAPPVATLALVRPLSRRWRVVPRLVATARSLRAVHRELRRWRPDVVNVHFIEGHAAYFLLLRPLFGYSVVLTAHGSDVLVLDRGSRSLPRLLPRADAVTAVSQPVADRVGAFAGVQQDRLQVIPNGVELGFWAEAGPADRDRSRSRSRSRSCTIVSVGRLHPVKGHDVLLQALLAVRERVPTAELVLIGEGEREQALREQARASGLEDAVVFAGHLAPQDVRARLRDADVFALPSRSEGMPLSLLEAMATRLAPVATTVGGVPDVVVPGTGLLVPPDDPVALADALTRVLADAALRDDLASAAQQRARQFTSTVTDDAYEQLFHQLTPRRSRGARRPPG